jgi:hypothetical protein
MVIKGVGGFDIRFEIDRTRGGRSECRVGDGEGDFEGLVDLDLRGAVVGNFSCGIYYVCPFAAVGGARCEAG